MGRSGFRGAALAVLTSAALTAPLAARAETHPGRAALASLRDPQLDVSATFAVDTTGVFRGVRSRRLNPSVWAALDIEWGDWYAGVFGQPTGFENETVPLFYSYGGIAPQFLGLDFNFGASYYAFPGASPQEYDLDADDVVDHAGRKGLFEGFAGVSKAFDFAEIEAVAFFSPDMYGETGRAWYYAGEIAVPIAGGFSFAAHYGVSEFAQDQFNDDYSDYAVGIDKTLFGFDLALRYSNVADLAGADEKTVFLSVSREFSLFSSDGRRGRRLGKIRNNWIVDKRLMARR